MSLLYSNPWVNLLVNIVFSAHCERKARNNNPSKVFENLSGHDCGSKQTKQNTVQCWKFTLQHNTSSVYPSTILQEV